MKEVSLRRIHNGWVTILASTVALNQVTDEQPEQIGSGQQLNPAVLQHPLGQNDQSDAKHHGQPNTDVQRKPLLFRLATAAGNRCQRNGIVSGENQLQQHQHWQQGQHLSPLISPFEQIRQRRKCSDIHGGSLESAGLFQRHAFPS